MQRANYIHATAIVEPTAELGDDVRIWHFTHVRHGAVIGDRTSIGQGCYVGGTVRIGMGCKIQNHVSLYDGVIVEDDVFLGPSCVFTNVTHPRAHVVRKASYATTLVQRGASVGANATIVCGVTIGAYAMVGAGAVVTRDVAAHAVVVGTPARRISWACRCGETLRAAQGADLTDPGETQAADLACQRCGDRYAEADGALALHT